MGKHIIEVQFEKKFFLVETLTNRIVSNVLLIRVYTYFLPCILPKLICCHVVLDKPDMEDKQWPEEA